MCTYMYVNMYVYMYVYMYVSNNLLYLLLHTVGRLTLEKKTTKNESIIAKEDQRNFKAVAN